MDCLLTVFALFFSIIAETALASIHLVKEHSSKCNIVFLLYSSSVSDIFGTIFIVGAFGVFVSYINFRYGALFGEAIVITHSDLITR